MQNSTPFLPASGACAWRGRSATAPNKRAAHGRAGSPLFGRSLADLPRLGLPIATHIQVLWRQVEREEAAGRRDLADEVRQELIREYPRFVSGAASLANPRANRFPHQ